MLLKNLRQFDSLCQSSTSELPLVLGRDFAGVVVGKGSSVTDFEIGDEVYGVVKPQNPGCHAEYTVTSNTIVRVSLFTFSYRSECCSKNLYVIQLPYII